jgi:hypothetical protein
VPQLIQCVENHCEFLPGIGKNGEEIQCMLGEDTRGCEGKMRESARARARARKRERGGRERERERERETDRQRETERETETETETSRRVTDSFL